MLELLKNETNVAFTENGAVAKATTGSEMLNFFAQAGAMRNRSEGDILQMFSSAYMEDPLLAMKALFYFRDVRGGQGERRLFRIILKHLAKTKKDVVIKNIHLISEYGRWDDIYELFGTELEIHALELIKEQFNKDMKSENPSILGKWLKSENTSSANSKAIAKIIRKYLDLTPREYRKALTSLRKKIDVTEVKMSSKKWNEIDYPSVPSLAMLRYRNAFERNDSSRYGSFVDALSKGEAKINVGTLYPYDLVGQVIGDGWSWDRLKRLSSNEIKQINASWNNLPDYLAGKKDNGIAVIDTSGSMHGMPIQVAISLGLYMSERINGKFKNHFFTFSDRPKLVEIKGDNLYDKVAHITKYSNDWDGSTNLEAVFKLILDTAVKNNISQDNMIDTLYIVSDMEFNGCVRGGNNDTLFNTMKKAFNDAGYKLPRLVFWNVNARNSQYPVTMTDLGVQLVSGASPSIYEQIVKGLSAYDLMIETLNQPRYNAIQV